MQPTIVRSILAVTRRDRPASAPVTQFVSVVKATIDDALNRGSKRKRAARTGKRRQAGDR
jgi:hypothetical protein